MQWLKNHVDTCIIVTGIVGSFLWMTKEIHCLDSKLAAVEANVIYLKGDAKSLKDDVRKLNTDMQVIKTVLIMQKILPTELAVKDHEE